MDRLVVRKAFTTAPDADTAAREFADRLGRERYALVVFFCSSHYELARLGRALQREFDGPLVGCTSAGEIASGIGYSKGGLVGVGLVSDELRAIPRLIAPLDCFDGAACVGFACALEAAVAPAGFQPARQFALLLIDAMVMLEEPLVAGLYEQLRGVALFGGSAGDDLRYAHTHVYHDGAFHENAALLTLCDTSLPFRIFRIQHFEPTATRLVITAADCAQHLVTEIDGEPAAQAYARALGLGNIALTPQIFAAHPVMLRIGGEYFVRSIQKVNEDGSLTFCCAIDKGLVLTVTRGGPLLDNLEQGLQALKTQMPELKLVLACDCILRRLELQQQGLLEQARPVLDQVEFVGFSSYGEQYNGIHVNQTLTGLALGG